MVRYATVGTGWIVDAFVKGAEMVDGMALAAVCSRSLEKGKAFANQYGVNRIFTSLEELAACREIDAVYIASPNSLHYRQSKLFLEHGKHVLCEKPATVTSGQMRELLKLSEERKLVYMEAIMMLHLPQLAVLKQAMDRIGKITSARFDFSQLSSKYPAYLAGELPNIFNPQYATGSFMDLGVYCIYPSIYFFGKPEEIQASAGFLKSGADAFGSCILTYPDKLIQISHSKVGDSRLGSEIIGDKGTIAISSISKLTGIRLVDTSGNEEELVGDIPKEVLMSGEARGFWNAINNDSGKMVTSYSRCRELALQVSETMEKIRTLSGIRFDLV